MLRALVAKAEAGRLDLVSLMARLQCESGWERLLIPAFVYFFQMLYPFRRVNDPARATAAAAGGCMLVCRAALVAAGGLDAIAGDLIDDCALARAIKPGGPIWLGLATESWSVRPYAGLGDIWDMVARSAYTQLRHSPMLLAATVAGMTLIYLVPPATVIAGVFGGFGPAAGLGAAGWFAMAVAYAPTLRFYRQPAVARRGAARGRRALYADGARFRVALATWRGRPMEGAPLYARPSMTLGTGRKFTFVSVY